MDAVKIVLLGILCLFVACGLLGGSCYGYPKYNVWKQSLSGEAELRKAEFSKKTAVEEAKAKLESATLNAQAEVERAKGVAEANKIIGDSLKDNDEYLRYLWILGLQDSNGETVYIPTEAGLPILESTRRMQTVKPTPVKEEVKE